MLEDLEIIEHIAELCATSNTASELARKLVHSLVLRDRALGAVFYSVIQSGNLDLIGSYGKVPNLEADTSIWSDNPIAKAVVEIVSQSGVMQDHDGLKYMVAAIPITRGKEPIGVAALLRPHNGVAPTQTISDASVRTIANTYSVWFSTLGLKANTGPINTLAAGEMTQRQKEVLRHMAQGQTNAQIAVDLILSESSIRQETVKIFRVLGVGSRSEAARKGLNLGLIDKTAI